MSGNYSEIDIKMEKTIKSLAGELASIRAGRANAAVLDKIVVDYYGVPTALNQMAAISVPEARMLVITPWDLSVLGAIDKAIQASDIGINPTNDGKSLRLGFPQLTEERRKELAKQVSKYGEEAKIAVRNLRRDAIEKFKDMKKKSEITEDDLKSCEKDIQDLTDSKAAEIDKIVAAKQKELMAV